MEDFCSDATDVVRDACLQVCKIHNPPSSISRKYLLKYLKEERGIHVVVKWWVMIVSSPKRKIRSCFTGVAMCEKEHHLA
ncbi:hypothetical protein TNCV_1393521 [Trichonephila clavipes]|nr:hypothetical protein TNCV_1393521 [Trichonephila clavipes]